jgi:hypothetical protein
MRIECAGEDTMNSMVAVAVMVLGGALAACADLGAADFSWDDTSYSYDASDDYRSGRSHHQDQGRLERHDDRHRHDHYEHHDHHGQQADKDGGKHHDTAGSGTKNSGGGKSGGSSSAKSHKRSER